MDRPPEAPQEADVRHQLLFELGRGGMGTVYLALARGPAGFNKLKVIKQLRYELAEDVQFLRMFMDEARLSARLNHPNIVQTNEVGFDGRNYFIELEFLEGQSFDALLRRSAKAGGCPIPIALWIIAQCCAGLHYAHELREHDGTPLSIVHRDVSPHNVFITYEGAVKVLDFGIAKAADSSSETRTGVVKGKATYMAPEQAARGNVDRRADIFAAGVMLWQILAGRRLYEGLSDGEIFLKLQDGCIPEVRSLVPSVPSALNAICAKALTRDPGDRYATAAEFQVVLEDYLLASGQPVAARHVAALVGDLFADRREAVRVEIDAQMRGVTDTRRDSQPVPLLDQTVAVRATETGSTLRTLARGSTDGETRELGNASKTPRTLSGLTPDAPAPEESQTDTRLSHASTRPDLAVVPKRAQWRPRRAVAVAVAAAATLAALAVAWRLRTRSAADTPLPATTVAPAACNSSNDCRAYGKRLVCSESRACVAAIECVTNKECADAYGGAPHVCRGTDGRCVDLKLHGCEVHANPGDLTNDETIWFGVLLPATGPLADTFGTPWLRVIELGRRDFADLSGGVTSRDGAHLRPLAFVSCDDATFFAEKARYLAEDLHVPGVIGFGTSKEVIDLAKTELIPHHVLSVVSAGASSLITTIPHPDGSPRLVWRTTLSSAVTAPAVAAILRDIDEPAVRATGAVASGEPIRVALLRRGTAMGLGFASALLPILHFNDRTALENDTNFSEIPYGDPVGVEAQPRYDRAIQDLIAFRPHVVLLVGGNETAPELLEPIERGWPHGAPRPLYVSSNELDDALIEFLGRDPSRRKRLLGVSVPSATMPNAQLVTHYNEVFSDRITTANAPSPAYDAFYLLAYAAVAAGGTGPLSGDDLARGIERLLPPGPRIDVGPAYILDGLGRLSGGGHIDLNGAMSPLDFSKETGETPFDLVVTCARIDDHRRVIGETDSGLEYSRTTDNIVGTSRCR